MSKILFTLAFYHDGGTLKPQFVVSCTPVTNLVMKGGDWKGARFSNTNAGAGARNRFEYSFTGGKSVTRVSLVMNTTAILPPMIWLSKHPTGPPTKTGPRSKAAEQARRKAEWEKMNRIEDAKQERKKNRLSGRRDSRSPREQYKEQEALEDSKSSRSSSRRPKLDDRSYESPRQDFYASMPDREARRLQRSRRQESMYGSPRQQYAAANRRDDRSASPPQQYGMPPPPYRERDDYRYSPSMDAEARRRERRRRQEAAARATGDFYADRNRHSRRRRKDPAGGDGADGLPGREEQDGDGGMDGGGPGGD